MPRRRIMPWWLILLALVVLLGNLAACDKNDDDDDDYMDDDTVDDDTGDDDTVITDDDSEQPAEDFTHPLLDLSAGNIEVPFPSLYFTYSVPQSPTGLRLTLEKELPNPVQLALDASGETDIAQAASELDGFSIIGPVLVPFSAALDLTPWAEESAGELHVAGEGFARLFDVTVEPPAPLGHWLSFIEGQNVLVLHPHRPLPPGHRILVCLVGPITDASGGEVVRPDLFDAVMKGADELPEDPLVEDMVYARDLIESGAIGVEPDDVLLAFSYPTGTGQSVLHHIREVLDDLDGQTPILPEEISYEDDRTIVGSFLSPEFRVDGIIPAVNSGDPTSIQEMVSLNFIVRLPAQTDGPLPPVIHLHGLGGSRYSAPTIDEMAVFAIDAVLHGDRDQYTGDAPYPFLDLRNLRLFRDNIRQTAADHFALARMIRHLAEDPGSFGLPEDLLATGTLGVQGHSLGCLNGATFASVDPAVDHLACVGGGGLFSIFQKQSAYGLFMPAAIRGLPPFEALIFRHLMQAAIDTADPAALASALTIDTPNDRPPRNVLIIDIIGDRSVPNRSTEAIARGAGLGVNEGASGNWYGLSEWPLPQTGNLEVGGSFATGLLYEFEVDMVPYEKHGHLFGMPEQLNQAHTFLLTAAETGIATIIDPEASR